MNEIFKKYYSDKIHHGYIKIYEEVLEKLADKPISFLEIGMGSVDESIESNMSKHLGKNSEYKPGDSLKAWSEYFSNSESNICGIDVDDTIIFQSEKITSYWCDSTDKLKVDGIFSEYKFDIIIDDGLHSSKAQIATYENFIDKMKKGGLYIIEDVYNSRGKQNPVKLLEYLIKNNVNFQVYTSDLGIKPKNCNLIVIKVK